MNNFFGGLQNDEQKIMNFGFLKIVGLDFVWMCFGCGGLYGLALNAC